MSIILISHSSKNAQQSKEDLTAAARVRKRRLLWGEGIVEAKGKNRKPLKPIEVIVAFVLIFGLGYIFFLKLFPAFFMWVVSTLDMSK